MTVRIIPEKEFQRQFKRLYKKYPSLKSDVLLLQEELKVNPYAGVDLGNKTHKVRMAIASKGKGKSGGARVITFLLDELENDVVVRLLTIYDKNEIESVSDSYIRSLIKEITD